MSPKRKYRWCFVPMCRNTQIKTPNKIFVQVPAEEKRRKLWFKAAHRPDEPTKSCYYCCEDHFNLKEDMENYMRFIMMGGSIYMKKDVVPHIFDCQPQRNIVKSLQPRPAAKKLNRKRTIAEMLAESEVNSSNETESNCENHDIQSPEQLQQSSVNKDEITTFPLSEISSKVDHVKNIIISNEEAAKNLIKVCNNELINNASIEKSIKKHRSKGIQSRPMTSHAECLTKPVMVDRQCSPIIIPIESSSSASKSTTISKSLTNSLTISEYQPSCEEITDLLEEKEIEMKRTALRLINYFISTDSKNYIGVLSKWLWIIEELQTFTSIPSDHIKLIFMKIKRNDTFRRLGDQFGLSAAGASRIFNRNIQKIAHVLQTLIYCPNKVSLKKVLPIPFRLNFSNVIGIIDCFEIQIEKPSNALHQALTWSEYKKCNTLKYLICISPDGLITFISRGYGGRVSDIELFEQSGIMNVLPEKCALMADRGFKQIQTILHKKQIELV